MYLITAIFEFNFWHITRLLPDKYEPPNEKFQFRDNFEIFESIDVWTVYDQL